MLFFPLSICCFMCSAIPITTIIHLAIFAARPASHREEQALGFVELLLTNGNRELFTAVFAYTPFKSGVPENPAFSAKRMFLFLIRLERLVAAFALAYNRFTDFHFVYSSFLNLLQRRLSTRNRVVP